MLKDLINIASIELSAEMFKIYFVRKYVAKTAVDETFVIRNPVVLLMKSGNFSMRLKQISQDLKPHDLLMLPKGTSLTQVEAGNRLQFFLIAFPDDRNGKATLHADNDILCCIGGSEALKISLDDNDYMVLSLICRLLYAEISNHLINEYELKLRKISFNLLLFELNLINVKYLSAAEGSQSRQEGLTSKFLAVLSIHCRKHHNLQFYSGVLYVSPQYLSEVVKKVTGKSAKTIINEALISEAVSLLEDTQFSIAEIAEELEFGSIASFSIFFKKATACTPSQYRKNTIERFKSR